MRKTPFRSLRTYSVDLNEPNHHMVCSKCKGFTDIGEIEIGLVSKGDNLPGVFLVERYAADVMAYAQSASGLAICSLDSVI